MTKNGGEAPMDPSDIFKHFMSSMGGWEVFPFGSSGFGSSGFGGPFEEDLKETLALIWALLNSNNTNYENCFVQLDVELEDLYNQKTVNVEYQQQCYCKKCNGYGTKDGSKSECSKCNGTGQVRITRQLGNMIQQIVRSCPDCNGTGERVSKNNICDSCNGKNLKLKIELWSLN